jgi:SWI/SNF-related matrix-associated actin-dependent regulator of chromatin subfamily A-like protein 1
VKLTEPSPGLFVLECAYEDRSLPKKAGFRWHPGERCRRRGCKLCAGGIGRAWTTHDPSRAGQFLEYAEEDLRSSLAERGARATEVNAEQAQEDSRALKRRKLFEAQSLRASQARDSSIDVPAPEGLDYLPFQRAGVAYAMQRAGTLLADEMGLGKTVEALGVINMDSAVERVLVVCPASLKLNWQRECERWLTRPMRVGVAGKTFPEDADVVILNYEILEKWKKHLGETWDLLIADECHYVKNKDAKRSKRLYGLKAERRLFLTGTPILNRPVELQAIVGALDPDEFGDFWAFAKRYCNPMRTNFGWDFSGASNLEELHRRLRSTVMVRRTKAEVLADLPAKRRQVIELDSSSMASLIRTETEAWIEHKRRLSRLRAHTREGRVELSEAELTVLRQGINQAFGDLAKLRRETALAKVPLVVEHVRAALEESAKVVLFAHHRDVIAELATAFGESAVTLTGETTMVARQAAVDRFQADPDITLFIGSITAAGVGLTLTAAAHVVFAELDWVPANMTQAEDRTHRIGQEESVLVQHLVLQDSLDARMVRTLVKKQRVVDEVTDGRELTELIDEDFAEELIESARRAQQEADGRD